MVQVEAKKRKVSKKTKRSWRKHIDIKDVDKFLENKRLDERLGTPFSERLDSELFVIDNERNNEPVGTLTTKKDRRLALKQKEPRCFAILKPHTAVPDPIAKRNRVKTPEERKNPITRLKEAKRKLNGQLKLKEKVAERNKALAESKRKSRFKRGDFTTDIWEEKPVTQSELNSEWLTSDTIRHTFANTGQKRKRVPEILYKKPSILPAVEAPHPGTSYNPSYNDHQELLVGIAEKEKKLIKEEEHLKRVTTKMFTKVTTEKKTENWINELSEGLPVKSNKKSEDSDLEDTDPVVKSVNPPVKNAKKTLVQRRKQKEQKQLALKQAKEKLEKKKVADVYKLRLLEKQLTSKELKAQELREKREKLKQRKMTEPKTLNKRKFEAPEPDFQMAEELAGSLRASAPVGNLLKDRFKSLQQRNILAPSALILKRNKLKVKRFIKPDHKIPLQ